MYFFQFRKYNSFGFRQFFNERIYLPFFYTMYSMAGLGKEARQLILHKILVGYTGIDLLIRKKLLIF